MTLPATLIFIVAIVYIVAHLIADKLIFQPQSCAYQDAFEILTLPTPTGLEIAAVYLPNPSATYTILYSHGNAADIGDIFFILEKFRDLGFAAFAYDYPGYGRSSGKPSERRLYEAVDAAYSYLTETLHLAPDTIIAYGHSLGGAVALDLASRKPVAGLVLVGSFVTAFRVVTRWPISPFDKFRNLAKIKLIHCPVLVMHGENDTIVPFWHGQQLL